MMKGCIDWLRCPEVGLGINNIECTTRKFIKNHQIPYELNAVILIKRKCQVTVVRVINVYTHLHHTAVSE
jgi:hypothetical protein